jgi:hypothetical protein
MTHRQHVRPQTTGTLDDLAGHVPDTHLEGARAASEEFRRQGIRHALCGGLAVGICGYPRHTSDIDFLVDDDAFDHHGHLVTHKPGLPISYKGVGIDWVSLEPRERAALDEFLVLPEKGVVPSVPVAPLVAMKLLAGRQKDQADVVELVKAGADVLEIREFIERNFPAKLALLDRLVELAAEEAR